MADSATILYEMRADLADWMSQRGYGSSVYLAEARIDETVDSYAIQLIPTQETAVHPNSGVGLIRANLDIVIWWRGFYDPMQRGTERIAGGEGIKQFAGMLREYLVQRSYTGMVIPLLFRSGGDIAAVDSLEGWLTMRDSWDFAYEMEWTVK
jgi:hypothetical protein